MPKRSSVRIRPPQPIVLLSFCPFVMNSAERFLQVFQSSGARKAVEALGRPLGTDLQAIGEAKQQVRLLKTKTDDPALKDVLELAHQWLHYQANIADNFRRQEDGGPSQEMMTNIKDRASIEKSLERAYKRYQRTMTASVVQRYLEIGR